MAILKKLYRWSLLPKLLHVLGFHFKGLFLEMDTVRDGRKFGFTKEKLLRDGEFNLNGRSNQQQKKSLSVNKAYIFPLLVLVYVGLDSSVVFYQNDWHYSPYGMENFLFHRIVGKVAWLQYDRVVLVALITFIFGYTFFLFDRKLDPKFVVYYFPGSEYNPPILIQHGKVLSPELSSNLIEYWKRMRTRVLALILYLDVLLSCFYLYYFFASHTGFWYDLVLFFLILFFTFNVIFFGYAVLLFFIQTAGYLLIKQKHLLTKIHSLSAVIELKVSLKESKNTAAQKALLWKQLNKIKAAMGNFYVEIAVQNRFWCKYLTLVFMFCVVESVTLSYATIFNNQIKKDSFIRAIFIGYGVDLLISCLIATWQSSKLVRTNVATAQQWQRCAMKLQAIYRFRVVELLKMDQMASNLKGVSKVSFRLLDNYRINSQMFEGIFFYTSVIFMTIFKDHHHIE